VANRLKLTPSFLARSSAAEGPDPAVRPAHHRLALAGCNALLRDPDYLIRERAESTRRPFHFDSLGLLLLVVVMVCWEVMLSKGQQWDWPGESVVSISARSRSFGLALAWSWASLSFLRR